MTEAQWHQLLLILQKMAEKQSYTLTGAADWYWVVVLVLAISGLLIYIWQDLKDTLKNTKSEFDAAIAREKAEREKDVEVIWEKMERCQSDCCPRKK